MKAFAGSSAQLNLMVNHLHIMPVLIEPLADVLQDSLCLGMVVAEQGAANHAAVPGI